MSRHRPLSPVEHRVDNLEDWYMSVLDEEVTTAGELDAFAKLADSDAEFTELLATDYLGIASMLAEHGNTSSVTLAHLLDIVGRDWTEAAYVLQAISRNRASTAEILDTVFTHGDEHAREAVVGHTNVSDGVLARAAADRNESVRLALTYDNLRVPEAVLQRLADSDPEEYIRMAAAEQLEVRVAE